MAKALARVLQDEDLTGPRGPDGKLTITVPRDWLSEERWVELDLPRTLTCARCDGGGCDTCDRSGAVDTRGRRELGEIVEIRLPASDRGAVVRLPKRGGLPIEIDATCGRGILLLAVVPGDEASRGVRVREEELAVVVPETPPTLEQDLRARWRVVALVIVIGVAAIFTWWLKHRLHR